MQPPNLHLTGWRFGSMCAACRYFERRDGTYWCAKYELIIRYGDICDDYEWDKKIRVA